ncbi:MAG: hypothetical protein HYY84_14015 [Deltaproteobacteria bacterium]|nr:hypothetical protein [Deltaproteobacteria bacterium]
MFASLKNRIFVRSSLGVLVASLGIGAAWAVGDGSRLYGGAPGVTSGEFPGFLASTLREKFELTLAEPDGAAFIPGSGFETSLVFAARQGDGAPDIYRAAMRLDGDGRPYRLATPRNLTKTPDAVEESLVGRSDRFAFLNRVDGRVTAVGLLDFRAGEDERVRVQMSRFGRVLNAFTNIQHHGAARGVGETRLVFAKPVERASLRDDSSGALTVEFTSASARGSVRATFVWETGELSGGGAELSVQRAEPKAEPMIADWVVNRIRDWSFVGEKGVEWLEAAVLSVADDLTRWFGGGTSKSDKAILEGERVVESAPAAMKVRGRWTLTGESSWPPPPIKPILATPLAGEGQWVDPYPYNNRNPGAPPAVLRSVIRVDPKREKSKVRLIVADARQVDLGIVAGTKFPETTTGHTGDGLIPRDPAVLTRVLAAFNGGFKTMHGAFGMMVRGREIVRPKPSFATVGRFKDGRLGFGTWKKETKGDAFESYRQNLVPLIENGVINPTGEQKWGITPLGDDPVYTYRAAVGVTAAGHIMYAWGNATSAPLLAKAMTLAGCVFAIHLDMNWGHTRFEWYRVYDEASLAGKLKEKMYEHAGVKFQARRMDPEMIAWLFPRYIKQDERDFFYLALRNDFPTYGKRTLAWSLREWPEPWRAFPTAIAEAQDGEARIYKARGSAFVGAAPGAPFNLMVSLGPAAKRREEPREGDRVVAVRADGAVEAGVWGVEVPVSPRPAEVFVGQRGVEGSRCVGVGRDRASDIVLVVGACGAAVEQLLKRAEARRWAVFATTADRPILTYAQGDTPDVAVEFDPLTRTSTVRSEVEVPLGEQTLRLTRRVDPPRVVRLEGSPLGTADKKNEAARP